MQRRPGFTLVEILIVVVILGILASLVVPQFAGASEESQQSAFVQSLRVFVDASEFYAAKTGSYPDDGGSGLVPPGFETYVDQDDFESPTPIGGVWDTELNDSGVGAAIGVHFISNDPGNAFMTQIDVLMDDGDLATGLFREIAGGRYYYVLAP